MTVTASPAVAPGAPTTPATPGGDRPVRGLTQLGALLIVVAEAMALGAILAVYFALKAGAPRWPPKGIHLGIYLPMVIGLTAVLSGAAARWAVFAVRRNDQRNAAIGLVLAAFFGLAMANADWYALGRPGLGASKSAYASMYGLLVGFHLLHLVLTIPALVVVAGRVLAGHFRVDDHEPVLAVSVLWQFGNVAWFVIGIVLYIMSHHR